MLPLSPQTLTMAIQAMAGTLRRLGAELDSAGDDADPDLQELHLCYELAAADLEEAYRPLCERFINLAPYEQLTAGGRGMPAHQPKQGDENGEALPVLSVRTLCMVVQAVDEEMRTLEEAAASWEPEDHQLYDDYSRAADALEAAYREGTATTSNMPSYEKLVSSRSRRT